MSSSGPPLMGRVAIVTGASRRGGIGFAIAKRLATLGANLFLHSFTPFDASQTWGADLGGIEALVDDLRRQGGQVEKMEADFAEADAPQQVIQRATDAFGNVDILVANHAHSGTRTIEQVEAGEIDRHLQVNVRATLLLIKAFAAQHDGPGGRIVLLTSGQHLEPMPDEIAYVASKGAIHQLTLSLSAHFIGRGITVNCINPGATDTGYANSPLYDAVLRREPLGRWGRPDDAARLIGWLATDEARWVTGQVINSTGGGP
jgi:3-oxoacyl-[acyl-carrier protein] reductase